AINNPIIDSDLNLGFGKACNLGIKTIAKRDPQGIIWLLNPDTYFPKSCQKDYWTFVQNLWKKHSSISLLGTTIYTDQDEIWFSRGIFKENKGSIQSQSKPCPDMADSDWISGCSLMLNLLKFETLPYFDPNFFLYYEDFDFCIRYKSQGHKIAITNQLSIVHKVSEITDRNISKKIYHSSYSYLMALYRHTNLFVFIFYLVRFILNACALLILRPVIGKAKFKGLQVAIHKIHTRVFQKEF
ncbi:MAG: hypothetical protein WBB82_08150, partial [Limnothrix sp.]